MTKANCEISKISVNGKLFAVLEDDNDKVVFAWDDRFDGDIYYEEFDGYLFEDGTPIMSLPTVDVE